MTERDIQQLVFHAGLSTAETVTALSGRDVGLDVARTNIDGTGGSIDVHSTKGRGSVFRLEIPTTHTTRGSKSKAAGERFTLPEPGVVGSAGAAG